MHLLVVGELVRRDGSRLLRLMSLGHGGLRATRVWCTVSLNGAWSLVFLVLQGLKSLCASYVMFAHLTNDILIQDKPHRNPQSSTKLVARKSSPKIRYPR